MKKRIILVIVVLLVACSGMSAKAWGPLTHLAVNYQAYEQALGTMRSLLCIPPELKLDFFGGGPTPDIKFNAGDEFPMEFHNSMEIAERMIKLAKQDPKFGLIDVVKALGYAGHLYSEVTTAHTAEGYPNSKMTIVVKGGWVNHQINELAMDILTYKDYDRVMKNFTVSLPIRLLEASMKAEQAREPSMKVMSANKIKAAANAFLLTPAGVRSLAEYILNARPDLVEEMNAYYADRHEAFDKSVSEVRRLLEDHGRADFGTKPVFTADKEDRVAVALSGTFAAKAKTVGLNLFARAMANPKSNDIFTMISYGVLKGGMTGLFRDRLKTVVNAVYSGQIPGDAQHQKIVARYIEGILFREDLTYPEILEFAMAGLELEPKSIEKRAQQFQKMGLKEGGRAPVDPNQLHVALEEVDRLERLTRDWPVFWPLRPSVFDVAQAREKAGRLLAYYFIDSGVSPTMSAKARQFLAADKALRGTLLAYKTQTMFNPFAKYAQWKTLSQASEAFRKDERFFGQYFDLLQAFGPQGADRGKLEGMIHGLTERIATLEGSVGRLENEKKQLKLWQLAERSKINEEIAKARNSANELKEQVKAYQEMLTATQAVGQVQASVAAAEPDVVSLEGRSLKEIQDSYQRAYAEYVQLLGQKPADAPEVAQSLERFRAAEALRQAALKQGLK